MTEPRGSARGEAEGVQGTRERALLSWFPQEGTGQAVRTARRIDRGLWDAGPFSVSGTCREGAGEQLSECTSPDADEACRRGVGSVGLRLEGALAAQPWEWPSLRG